MHSAAKADTGSALDRERTAEVNGVCQSQVEYRRWFHSLPPQVTFPEPNSEQNRDGVNTKMG